MRGKLRVHTLFGARDLDSKVHFLGGDVEDLDMLSFHIIVTRHRNEDILRKNFLSKHMCKLPVILIQ